MSESVIKRLRHISSMPIGRRDNKSRVSSQRRSHGSADWMCSSIVPPSDVLFDKKSEVDRPNQEWDRTLAVILRPLSPFEILHTPHAQARVAPLLTSPRLEVWRPS